jgi:hydrogenase maturation protease
VSVARVVVIGYGNPLRRDDGAGWYVAEVVAERWGERVTVLLGQQPVPEWAETLADADVAFIVDASVDASVADAQRVRLRRVLPAKPHEPGFDGHEFDPRHLLRLSLTVYGRAPATYLLALPVEDLSFGDGLSSRTQRAATQAIRLLDRQLATLTSTGG